MDNSENSFSLKEVMLLLREADLRYIREMRAADYLFYEERDRRYSEVAIERSKALVIKDAGDAKADKIDRDNRAYRDEAANDLRHQIESERGLYPTKAELKSEIGHINSKLDPVIASLKVQEGRSSGFNSGWLYLLGALSLLATVIGIFNALK